MFTQEEKEFLVKVLRQLNINPSGSEALKTVQIVQSILATLAKSRSYLVSILRQKPRNSLSQEDNLTPFQPRQLHKPLMLKPK